MYYSKYLIFISLICLSFNAFAEQTYTASWYSVESCKREGTWQKYGGKMANGKEFKNDRLTCASWDHPFGTLLGITNTHNGKSVVVEVSDRGPAKRLYRMGRVIDLSKRAFSKIASLEQGVIPIQIEVIHAGI